MIAQWFINPVLWFN